MGIKKDNYDLSQAAHPFACIFTFLFKATAFIMYIMRNLDIFLEDLYFQIL